MPKETQPTVRTAEEIYQEAHERAEEYFELNKIPEPTQDSEIPMAALRAGYYGEKLFQELPIISSNEVIPGNDR